MMSVTLGKKNIAVETVRRLLYLVPELPSYVQIEITNDCNLSCKMCPREVLNVKFVSMPLEKYKLYIDKIAAVGVEQISLTGWGEPLVHPHLIECLSYAKSKGLITKFTTNGVLIRKDVVEPIIATGVDEITFSIDSINMDPKNDWAHLNKVALKRIEDFIRLRKEKNQQNPKIILQTMLQKNHSEDIFDVIKWAGKTGCDAVNLGRLNLSFDPNLDRPNLEEEKFILDKAESLGTEYNIQVDCVQGGMFSGIARFAYKKLKKYLHRGGKTCLKTYDYCYINVHGKVTPCCLLPNTEMGDLNTGELHDIWNNDAFKSFREHETAFCGSCDVMRVDMLEQKKEQQNAQKAVEEGKLYGIRRSSHV
ncbi:radical SAM protein [Candidatus Woesearchaeota archaeon]|nr:radical SAM protein [Candidatus Woesearchaeota archaeon]